MQRVGFKEFREMVSLWKSKGHENVTRVEFDDIYNYMLIVVPDYVNPAIGYFMNVSDDMDWDSIESNPIAK